MSQNATLARLENVVADELDQIDSHQDELLGDTYAKRGDPVKHYISKTILGGSHEGWYFTNQTTPTPLMDIMAEMFINMAERDHSADPQLLSFVTAQAEPFIAAHENPLSARINFKRNNSEACESAEGYFNAALKQVRSLRSHGQRIVSAYHDSTGSPILFRKSNLESTALTLVPIHTAGIVLPPGTIVGVSNGESTEQAGVDEHLNYTFKSIQLSDEDTIMPVRLSPWAYADPIDRSMFACEGQVLGGKKSSIPKDVWYNRYRAEMLRRTSIEDFTAAAAKIVEFCAD